MSRLTEDAVRTFFEPSAGLTRFWQPPADLHETDDGLVIKIELAGVPPEAVTVALSADGRRLTVSGARTEPESERCTRRSCRQLEIYFGPFERTFQVPEDIRIDRERITASLKNGFLTIEAPRWRVVRRTIPVEMVEGSEA